MYEIYFEKVLFPVAPSKIKTKIKNKNKTIELINEGEVNLLKDAGLTEISFSLRLPNVRYSFGVYPDGFKPAIYYLDILEGYKKSKKPFPFKISRVAPDGKVLFYNDMNASIEDYSIDEDANEGTDIIVSVSLLQHREYGLKTVNLNSQTKAKQTARPEGKGAVNAGKPYTIQSGDTLWNIAKEKYGDGTKWKQLYNSNKAVIEAEAKKRGFASSGSGMRIWPRTTITL